MKKRICLIGLHEPEYQPIKEQFFGPIMIHEVLPKIALKNGILYVERSSGFGMLPVSTVVYHGIFGDDLDFIAALALWGGPCYPNPLAMMNCRLKLPCLVRALQHTRFPIPNRGYVAPKQTINMPTESVAKWGNWHCGENKERFTGAWQHSENACIIEPFLKGESVRVIIIGQQAWQIKLEGKDWLKSIHPDEAAFMPLDEELLADTQHLKKMLDMDIIANDYIVGEDGQKYLLEVNHIPNVTRFEETRRAYLDIVVTWLKKKA